MHPEHEPLRPYLGAFVDALVEAGIEDLCFCPGSRSTPLILLFEEHPQVRLWSLLDERGMAFFALGMARAKGSPVAILTTSGTAAANLLPAATEAHHNAVPLVMLTADRPEELQDVGGLQTVDQIHLFGSRTRWFHHLPVPDGGGDSVRHARWVAARAVDRAVGPRPGPVHLNFPLREPLIPARAATSKDPRDGKNHEGGYRWFPESSVPDDRVIDELAREIGSTEKGLIVCGPQDDLEVPAAVLALSQVTGFPVLADVLSQVRCDPLHHSLVLDAYDSYLRDPGTSDRLQPDLVIRVGGVPVSKALQIFLSHRRGAHQLAITGNQDWADPMRSLQTVMRADVPHSLNLLSQKLQAGKGPGSSWSDGWRQLDRLSRDCLHRCLAEKTGLSEPRLFQELADALPGDATVFVGNSMPVRDLDSFFPGSRKQLRFLGNRGASGIDGLVSSALGVAAAGQGPLVAVLGDISFYHDLNGLLAAQRFGLDATFVIVNNDGGGIFSFLPQHDLEKERFERLFGTPHRLGFQSAADLFSLRYSSIETWQGFRQELQRELAQPGTGLLEIRTGRTENRDLHGLLWDQVANALPDPG